ncbi:MAG: molybdopterin-binding protein, partial [bacterium]
MTESKGISSAVVAVGDELLIGETLDGNGSWLSKKLTNLGTPVTGRWVTGDDPVAIKQTIMTALEKSELVIVTGGLGPTIDDLTRPSVAELFGLKLIVNQSLVDQLRSRFSTIGYETLPVRNLVQAEVPEGAIIIPNCEGTAPGLIIENEGKSVVLLPGVPHEMQSMFDRSVTEYINKRFQSRLDPILQRTFNTSGIPESLLAEELDKDISRFPSDVSVAFLPGLQGVSLRLTAPFSGGQGLGSLDFCENIIETTLAPYCYSVGKKSIMDSLAECLLMDKKCFAVGESCTGGLISKHITDLPGSS